METIRTYLENMFANLPNTPKVKKAKDELWQMMEDKYNELIADGMSDNAAVGTVISEFGNLDEIADELGIEGIVEAADKNERREISLDEVKEFLTAANKQAWQIAIGVALCIMSMVAPIVADAVDISGINGKSAWVDLGEGISMSVMFVLIAIGVILFIYSSLTMKKWSFIEKEACSMSVATTDYVKESETAFTPKYALMMSIGVALCIISFVPAAFMEGLDEMIRSSIDFDDLGGAFMFVLVAIGVLLIVYAANVKGNFEKLIKATLRRTSTENSNAGEDFGSGESKGSGNVYTYSEDDNDGKVYISSSAELVMDVFWPTITCIYLCWSFITFDWYITWIIWPIAGVLHGVLKSMLMKRV